MHECPTCLQHISEEYKRNIHNKTEEETKHLQKNLNDFSKRKNELIEKLEQVKKQKEELKKRKAELELLRVKRETITEKEQRIIENETMRKKLEEDIQLLKKHTESLDKTIGEFEKYTIIFEEKNKELTQLQSKENEYAIKQAEINKEIQFIDQQIEEKMQQIEKKEQLRKKIDHIRELEYWMSEKFIPLVLFTEKQVMLTLKEEFSTLFSKWFSILVSDTLSAKLNDEFSPIIEQQDYELDYGFLSGGERTAIALAYRLALNQVINSLLSNIKTGDLVILDEPTDGFSSTQLDKMRDVLTQLKVAQLILVSHEQKIEGFVDNVIRLRKREDVTEVVN
jgi:DNA repair protein SbcC/Rad50